MATAIFCGFKQEPEISEYIEALIRQGFTVVHSENYDFGDDADQHWMASLQADYLFSFGPLIIKEFLIDSLSEGAINFHPAPPRYPGRGGSSRALYNNERTYGVTAHLMTERIDAGPILEVLEFDIPVHARCDQLHALALQHIPTLAQEVIEKAGEGRLAPTTRQTWEGEAFTSRDLAKMMIVYTTDQEGVMRKKIKAFRRPDKPGPFLQWRGRLWAYVEDE